MYSASMALYDARSSKWTPLDDWSWLDEIQYRYILRKIRKEAIKRKTYTYINNVRVRVKMKLELDDYKVTTVDIGLVEYVPVVKVSWDNLRGE